MGHVATDVLFGLLLFIVELDACAFDGCEYIRVVDAANNTANGLYRRTGSCASDPHSADSWQGWTNEFKVQLNYYNKTGLATNGWVVWDNYTARVLYHDALQRLDPMRLVEDSWRGTLPSDVPTITCIPCVGDDDHMSLDCVPLQEVAPASANITGAHVGSAAATEVCIDNSWRDACVNKDTDCSQVGVCATNDGLYCCQATCGVCGLYFTRGVDGASCNRACGINNPNNPDSCYLQAIKGITAISGGQYPLRLMMDLFHVDGHTCSAGEMLAHSGWTDQEALPALTSADYCMLYSASVTTCNATNGGWERVCACLPPANGCLNNLGKLCGGAMAGGICDLTVRSASDDVTAPEGLVKEFCKKECDNCAPESSPYVAAASCIDGNATSFCHSDHDNSAPTRTGYLELDFGEPVAVSSLIITGSTAPTFCGSLYECELDCAAADSCPEYCASPAAVGVRCGTAVRVGGASCEGGIASCEQNALCTVITSHTLNQTVKCSTNVVGRYLQFTTPGRASYLSFSDIQVLIPIIAPTQSPTISPTTSPTSSPSRLPTTSPTPTVARGSSQWSISFHLEDMGEFTTLATPLNDKINDDGDDGDDGDGDVGGGAVGGEGDDSSLTLTIVGASVGGLAVVIFMFGACYFMKAKMAAKPATRNSVKRKMSSSSTMFVSPKDRREVDEPLAATTPRQ